MTREEIASTIWAETRFLREMPDAPQAARLDRARQLVAQLAASDDGRGFPLSDATLTAADAPLVMAAALNASSQVQPGTPQPRLLLWESAAGDKPDRTADLPAPWASLDANAVTSVGAFSAFGKYVWLFARVPGTDGGGGPIFASRVTGTGLAGAGMDKAAGRRGADAAPRLGLWLALAAAIVFVAAGVWCYELGAGVADYCAGQDKSLPCKVVAAGHAAVSPAADLGFLHDARSVILKLNGNFSGATLSVSAEAPYLMMCLAMLMALGAIGLGITGLLPGALIDDRNRLSLTTAQAAAWGVLLFPAIAAFAIVNVGHGAAPMTAFPSFENTWVLLGIVGISPVASKAVMGMLGPPAVPTAQKTVPAAAVPDYLDRNASPREAALWDMVVSESAGADHLVDMDRVQHVGMTIILLAVYLTQLTRMVSIIGASGDGGVALLPGLPGVSDSFLAILVVSHAALIGGKWSANRVARS